MSLSYTGYYDGSMRIHTFKFFHTCICIYNIATEKWKHFTKFCVLTNRHFPGCCLGNCGLSLSCGLCQHVGVTGRLNYFHFENLNKCICLEGHSGKGDNSSLKSYSINKRNLKNRYMLRLYYGQISYSYMLRLKKLSIKRGYHAKYITTQYTV